MADRAVKIDSTNKVVEEAVTVAKQTNDSLSVLKEKVEANEMALRRTLEETEERIKVQGSAGAL